MNYSFQSVGLRREIGGEYTDGHFDYSRFDSSILPDLIETELSEPEGLRAENAVAHYGTVFYCQATLEKQQIDGLQQAVNWNCDEDDTPVDEDVASDINRDGIVMDGVWTDPTEPWSLTSVNEWQHLRFAGGAVGDFAGAVVLPETTSIDLSPELTFEWDQELGHYLWTSYLPIVNR